MNKFEGQLNKKEQPILNEWDKKILLEGGKNLVEKILKEFRGRLPDGIIYPDESARPLSYLFNPIFEKISKEKNRRKPLTFFMKVSKPDTHTVVFEDNAGHELFYDEAKKEFLGAMEGLSDSPDLQDYFMKVFENTHTKRVVEQERATEIEEYNEKLSGRGMIAHLAVIDEFSNQGHTAKEINYAFGHNIPYFSVFGSRYENSVSEENMGLVIDWDSYPKNPTTDNNTKLSFTKGEFKKSIGVHKNSNIENKYSEINENQIEEDRKMVEKLRKEMGEIGRKIEESY